MNIVIFAGTTEGRKLSAMLGRYGCSHHVCVATKYGAGMMENTAPVMLSVGRMDASQMKDFFLRNGFQKGDIIVDATHPYATEVSSNIRKAAPEGCRLIRILREASPQVSDNNNYVNYYDSVSSFAEKAGQLSGNILITTGSKELPGYCRIVSKETLKRTFVRILPSVDSLKICDDCGIAPDRIIAMCGPFSYEINKAVMTEYGIAHMLTKDGGMSGGYEEKISAASDLMIGIHVITRPGCTADEQGITVDEAFTAITGKRYRPKRSITVAGIGMGSASCMTEGVKAAICRADALFGAKRMIRAAKSALPGCRGKRSYEMYLAEPVIGILEKEVDITSPVILFSGDAGFYSGAAKVVDAIRKWDTDADIAVLPGISSVSYLASKLCEPYDDAKIVSIHGRNSLHNMDSLADDIASNKKVFALVSGDEDIRYIARKLKELGAKPDITAGIDLSYDDEEIVHLTVEEAAGLCRKGSITVLFKNMKS